MSPCLFNLYAEYTKRNINNLRYADDTTLMAESEEELKSLLMKVIGRTGVEAEAEYIMRNAGLEEAQAGIKIARRNIINLRYADDTTLVAESEEERKSLLMRVREESERASLKLNIKKK